MSEGLIQEYYGTELRATYRLDPSRDRLIPMQKFQGKSIFNQFSLRNFFRDVFLPQGYPESVTDDYLEYQCWDTLQAFCSSLTGTLATQAILTSVGVGDQSATAMAATLTWILKDGAGMIGRIAFAWAKGSQLDCDSKSWRLVADILNDLAIFVDILTPYFKPLFIYMVCFSSVCRSIVGVAGGATRAALTQHQARRNNLADVSAKDGSQETLVNLSALMCSFLLVPIVSGNTTLIWTFFCILTCFHLFANYRAVRSLRMDTINMARYRILINNFFNNGSMTIGDVNKYESLLNILPNWDRKVDLGCSFSNFVQVLHLDPKYRIGFGSHPSTVCVALHRDANAVDVMKGAFHAELIRIGLNLDQDKLHLITSTWHETRRLFPSFLLKLHDHGWVTTHTLLYCDEYRYDFPKIY